MKLHQEIAFYEGQGPVPTKLTLGEIIRDGKVTNPYQIFVLAWLTEFFKNGIKPISLYLENPISFGSAATSTDVISGLKGLDAQNQVQLAMYLSDCIDAGESMLASPDMNTVEWMNYVLRKQA